MKTSTRRVLSMGKKGNKHRVSGAILAVALFVVGVALGAGMGISIAPDIENDAAQVANFGEISVLPDTVITWKYSFGCCGHEISKNGARGYVGKSVKQICDDFPNATVTVDADKNVTVKNTVDEYCPKHYVLLCTDIDTLCVFKTDEKTLEPKQVSEIELALTEIDPALLSQLQNGLVFESLGAVNAYLESVDS